MTTDKDIDTFTLSKIIEGKDPAEVYILRYIKKHGDMYANLGKFSDESAKDEEEMRALEYKIGESLGDLRRRTQGAERLLKLYENVFSYASLLTSVHVVLDAYEINPEFSIAIFRKFLTNFQQKIEDVTKQNMQVCDISNKG